MSTPELTRHHVIRADLPWRKADLTECGRRIDDVGAWVTADKVKLWVEEYGNQRAAFLLCMTCWQTSGNYSTWEQDPANVISRHCQRWGKENELEQLRAELRAIAALVDAHREEFDDYIAGLGETIDLASRRRRAR